MATRKKVKPKRKRTPPTRGRKRRKTIGKTSAIRKKAAKKAPVWRASAKKTRKSLEGTAKLAPVRPQPQAEAVSGRNVFRWSSVSAS